MIHKELLGKSELRGDLPKRIIVITVVFGDSLDTLSDEVAVPALLNQFRLDVIVEQFEGLRVVFPEDFSPLVLIILHENEA